MNPESAPDFTAKLDRTAVLLSLACLVHCLALPLLIVLFPVLGFEWVPHETFHQLIVLLVVPSAAIALGIGCRGHHSAVVAGLGTAGVAALVLAAFVVHAACAEFAERWITVAGGVLLAAAHLRNYRLRRCAHHHRRPCPPTPTPTPIRQPPRDARQ